MEGQAAARIGEKPEELETREVRRILRRAL